jgi:hypothetical protein
MPLDVRIPISGLFGVVGLLLLGYGILVEGLGTSAGRLNGLWGAVMVIFAAVLGYYGARGERRSRIVTVTPEPASESLHGSD